MRQKFEDYKRSGTANNITVAILAIFGIVTGAKSFTGTQIALVEYCFKPETATYPEKFCTPDKRYVMPESEFYAETYAPANPEFQRGNFIPDKATRLRTIPPSNPHKPIWGLAATALMFSAYSLSKARTKKLLELIPEYREATKTDWLISKLWHGLRLHKEAHTAQLDYDFHQWSEGRRVKQAQLAAMSPQELAIYQQQVRRMAEAEAQARLAAVTQAQLPGQSMDDVARSDDKVNGTEQQQIASGDNTISEVLQRVAREDGSTALCGDPGTGKSTITREYIHQVKTNCPGAEMRVLAVKNDSFCGLREQGKVTRFIGENALENAKTFFLDIQNEYNDRLELTEDERQKLSPFVVILDDWLTISARLNKVKPEDLGFDFGQILFDVLIVGREYNMKFFVNLHSLNLGAIGIKELDQNTRKCLRLLLLGNRYRKDGRDLDAYGVIEQAIMGNQVITHAKDKEAVRAKYTELKAQSRAQFQPVMFAFIGGYYLGLVPKFKVPETPIDREYMERVYQLEFEGVTNANERRTGREKLSPQARQLFDYLTRTEKIEASVKDIQPSFKVKGERFTVEQIKGWMYEIVGAHLADWVGEGIIKLTQI